MTVEIPNPLLLSPENGGLTLAQLIEALGYGVHLDAGGRLRTSDAASVFDSSQEYNFNPLVWEHYTVGGGTATYTQALNSSVLSTAAGTSGNRSLRRTKTFWRYQPGKSQLIKMTGVLAYSGTPAGNAVARIGSFSDANGMFFGRDATGYFVCIRSNTSGSVVENKVYRADWYDPLDGSGPSRVSIDFTKTQIFVFDFLWLGSGPVRFQLMVGGRTLLAHTINSANLITSPYMRTANLPLSYEVFNDSGAGSDISLLATCASIDSEGGLSNAAGFNFRAGTAGSTVACANTAALTPIVSLRLKDTFGGITYRGHVIPKAVEFLNTSSNPGYYELVWNATLTGATFANSVDATYSGVEYDTAATVLTGGIVLQAGYISAGGVGSHPDIGTSATTPSKLVLSRTYNNTRDILTVAARGIGGAATIGAALNFREQY